MLLLRKGFPQKGCNSYMKIGIGISSFTFAYNRLEWINWFELLERNSPSLVIYNQVITIKSLDYRDKNQQS